MPSRIKGTVRRSRMSTPSDPLMHEWLVQLARETVPDEAELAPLIVDAYIAGGLERDQFFSANHAPGAAFVDPGSFLVLPQILLGIVGAGAFILNLLGGPATFKDALGAVCNTITISEHVLKVGAPPPATDPSEAIGHIVDVIVQQLKDSPLSDMERELMAYRILRALLENPEGTAAAIDRLQHAAAR